jgi:hypothetical protein
VTHWIVERMYYEQHYGRRSRRHRYHGGLRVSCDDGVSWVVAGVVRIGGSDTVEQRDRELDVAEFAWRCQQARTIRFDLPLLLSSARLGTQP